MTPAVLAFPRCIPAPLASRLWTTRTPRQPPLDAVKSRASRRGWPCPSAASMRISRCRRVSSMPRSSAQLYRADDPQTGTPPLNCRCFHLRSFVSPSGSLAVATHRTSVRDALVRSVSSAGRMPPSDAHRISPRVRNLTAFPASSGSYSNQKNSFYHHEQSSWWVSWLSVRSFPAKPCLSTLGRVRVFGGVCAKEVGRVYGDAAALHGRGLLSGGLRSRRAQR